MKSVRHFSSFIVFATLLGVGTVATAADPAVGTWTMHQTRTEDLKKLPRLVIDRVEGDDVAGYIDWNTGEDSAAIEILAGRIDRTNRSVAFQGMELQSPFFGRDVNSYEGILSDDGKSFTGFHPVDPPNQRKFSVDWRDGDLPKVSPEVAASLKLSSDRARLLQLVSADYATEEPIVFFHGRNPAAYRLLLNSADAAVRTLAESSLDYANRASGVIKANFDPEKAKADLDPFKLGLRGVPPELLRDPDRHLGKAMEELISGDSVDAVLSRERAQIEIATAFETLTETVRRALKDDYEKTHPDIREFASKDFRDQVLVLGVKGTAIKLRNDTGRDLHGCLVQTHMTSDPEKVEAYRLGRSANDRQTEWFAALPGMNLAKAKEAEAGIAGALVDNAKTEKSTTTFVPLWRNDVTMFFDLPAPEIIGRFGERIELWIGSDEGVFKLDLDMTRLRTSVMMYESAMESARRPHPLLAAPRQGRK